MQHLSKELSTMTSFRNNKANWTSLIAEENVYEEAVLDESPREENLPCDKDDVMERFLKSQPVISTASHTTTTLGTQSYETQETPNMRPLGLPDSNHRVLPKPTANSTGAGYLETLQMPASQRIQAAARDKPPPLDASTPAVSQPPVPMHRNATSTTLRHSPPVIDSFPRTTPFVSPSVRYEADAYTPAPRAWASPSTADGLQIAEALAKVTQLQRLPQAKPDSSEATSQIPDFSSGRQPSMPSSTPHQSPPNRSFTSYISIWMAKPGKQSSNSSTWSEPNPKRPTTRPGKGWNNDSVVRQSWPPTSRTSF